MGRARYVSIKVRFHMCFGGRRFATWSRRGGGEVPESVAERALWGTVVDMGRLMSLLKSVCAVVVVAAVSSAVALTGASAASTKLGVRPATYIAYPTTDLTAIVSGPARAVAVVTLYGTFMPEAGSCTAGDGPYINYAKSPLRSWSVRLGESGHFTLHTGKRSATGCYVWRVRIAHKAPSPFSGFLLTLPGTTVT